MYDRRRYKTLLLCIRITRDVKNWSFFLMENEVKYVMLVLYAYTVRACVFSFFHKPRPRLHIKGRIRPVPSMDILKGGTTGLIIKNDIMKSTPIPRYKKDVKALILKETFKLLLTRNLKNITIADMEMVTGVTRGAIFYHMKNKKEVIEQAIFTHLFTSFNPYFPINSLYTDTLGQYITAKIGHLTNISLWLDKEDIHVNIGSTFFNLLSQLEECHPGCSELIQDMQKKDRLRWETIIGKAVSGGEVETAMDIKRLATVFNDSYTGFLLYEFGQKQDMQDNCLYVLYDLIRRK